MVASTSRRRGRYGARFRACCVLALLALITFGVTGCDPILGTLQDSVSLGSSNTQPDGDAGNDGSAATVTLDFENPEDPTVTFSGSTDTLRKGDVLTVGADGGYSGHVWRLNGRVSHAALTATGSSATIDTSHLDHGTHTVSVVVAEGYSAQFSFLVKDQP
jgi:hypothetical protein